MSFFPRTQSVATEPVDVRPQALSWRRRLRIIVSRTATVLAFVLLWAALVSPNQPRYVTAGTFLRIPLEGLVIVAVGLLLPPRWRRILAGVAGAVFAVLAIIKLLNLGFFYELDRPFNPIGDWASFGPAAGVLRDSAGELWAVIAVVGAILLVLFLLVFVTMSAIRVTTLAARHRSWSARVVTALAAVWVLFAALGVQAVGGASVASATTARLADSEVHLVQADINDQHTFAAELKSPDPFAITPGKDLLTGLRGKDVLVVFVESYGQVAVQGTFFSPPIDALLKSGTTQLQAAGYTSKSAFMTSPTFGGISWLAHSTLQTGLWVDNVQRYAQLTASNRLTLSDAFNKAGWRTVADVPSNEKSWPEGKTFYHYDQLYNQFNVGYEGPNFSYAKVPDQWTLAKFQQLELKPGHAPVFAEIDLDSSHTPWAPLPHIVPENALGNGSIYDGVPQQGQQPAVVWRSAHAVQANYGQSVQYSMTALISWLQTVNDKNLVVIALGDHQPATIVSGSTPTHDVPISIISQDPKVMDRISAWDWQDGLLPSPQAPVWSMDTFRGRFLTSYGPHPPSTLAGVLASPH
ncbi:MAG TPA: sulfatase-like hydrolase/transferase [Acidothermaceae bacterium]